MTPNRPKYMIDSCTSIGVERNTAMYAPEMVLTTLFLLRRISASSIAGMTARLTETIASSSVYSTPCTKKTPYFGRNEKLKKLAGLMSLNRLLHHMNDVSLQNYIFTTGFIIVPRFMP